MPFGTVSSRATVVKGLRKLLGDLEDFDSYVDGIVVHSQEWEEHLVVLQEFIPEII